MPSGHYDREHSIGTVAIEAAREWVASPDFKKYRNLTAGGSRYAKKHGISLTSISRARVILSRDMALADAVSGGRVSLHAAMQELIKRGGGSLTPPPQEAAQALLVLPDAPPEAVMGALPVAHGILDRLKDVEEAIRRLERRIDARVTAGQDAGARKSDFPQGWGHLSERQREEWRRGKAARGKHWL